MCSVTELAVFAIPSAAKVSVAGADVIVTACALSATVGANGVTAINSFPLWFASADVAVKVLVHLASPVVGASDVIAQQWVFCQGFLVCSWPLSCNRLYCSKRAAGFQRDGG